MGVAIEGGGKTASPETFEIMGQNSASFQMWLAVETQWRVAAGMGGITWLGLDYSAVDVVLRRSRLEDEDGVFADLMLMEAEALSVFAKVDR